MPSLTNGHLLSRLTEALGEIRGSGKTSVDLGDLVGVADVSVDVLQRAMGHLAKLGRVSKQDQAGRYTIYISDVDQDEIIGGDALHELLKFLDYYLDATLPFADAHPSLRERRLLPLKLLHSLRKRKEFKTDGSFDRTVERAIEAGYLQTTREGFGQCYLIR